MFPQGEETCGHIQFWPRLWEPTHLGQDRPRAHLMATGHWAWVRLPRAAAYPREASTVRYWLICSMAASSSVWMLRRLCSRASRCCRSWPSRARSSSGVSPAKPAGGTGMGGKAKGGGRGTPIQGGGKGKPAATAAAAAAAAAASGPGAEPGTGDEAAAPAGRESVPALVEGGAAASPELGGGGTGGKGAMGGHSGNMPGGKGGRRPWGTAERRGGIEGHTGTHQDPRVGLAGAQGQHWSPRRPHPRPPMQTSLECRAEPP